jgi:4a-hydroxytetrahydrobiopterin dehydratase
VLTRRQISAAVDGLGWRYVLGGLQACIPVDSLAHGLRVAAHLAASVPDAATHLAVDVRTEHVVLRLRSPTATMATAADVQYARSLAAAVAEGGLELVPGSGGSAPRAVQGIEVAVDAMDIAAVRPFWRAVLDYVDEPGAGPEDALVDPLGQGPSIWFQQMDAPRPQRNRIHLDVSVPPDAAQARIAATLAAGGRLLADDEAPAFWVLADPEGNEVCICTWEGRDPPDRD